MKSATSTTTINTLVIFVRFNGAPEFYQNHSYYEPFFNGANQQSLKNYIQEVSYSNMAVNSTFYPVCASDCNSSYEDTNTRDYYINHNYEPNGYLNDAERLSREHGLVKRAVDAIASQVPTGINLDADNDGKVDHVCIVVQAGSANVDQGDLLWPHRWALYSQNAYINNKQVYDYTFLNTGIQFSEETICHEFLHVVGMPDTYHNSQFRPSVEPTGYWDIMGNAHDNFPHPGAYLKNEYAGWINSIPEITQPGTYTLSPLTSSSNNCYKIKPQSDCDEYFIVEYRKRNGLYENTLEGDGLLIYRIYPNGDNYSGPNDEAYIYRPNGTLTVNGSPTTANYSSQVGRTSIADNTNPSAFLKNGVSSGLRISNIGSSGTTISFAVDFNITISGPSFVCYSGASYSINNLPTGASITWTPSANLTRVSAQGSNPCIFRASSLSTSGTGIIQASINSGCGDILLPTVYVLVGPQVPGPISVQMDSPIHRFTASIQTVPTADSYNWYLNGVMNSSHDVSAIFNRVSPYCGGSYNVDVESHNPCGWSAKRHLTVIEPSCLLSLVISPNPTETESTIEIYEEGGLMADLSEEWDIEVYDQHQALREKKTKLTGNQTKINTSNWKDGVYIVRAIIGDEVISEKMVVKH